MKNIFRIFVLLFSINSLAQQSLVLDPKSMTVPRYANLSAIQAAINTPQTGMMVYNIATQTNWTYNGDNWINSAETGASQWVSNGDNLFYRRTYSNDTAIEIQEEGPASTSKINVPLTGTITNPNSVKIFLNIQNSCSGHLKITLVSPSGTEIILFNHFGCSTFSGNNTIIFNNVALGEITEGNPVPSGTYLPTGAINNPPGSLSNLSGLTVYGNWSLKIEDNFFNFDSYLLSWGIIFGDEKIGIGTSNPTAMLDVQGKINSQCLNTSKIIFPNFNFK